MKFTKGRGRHLVRAHRDYFVTLVRHDGTREPWFLPYCYRTEAQAQAQCDKRNPYYKHGKLVVDFTDQSASWGYDLGSIKL